MSTFVFVHGGMHAGWCWEKIVPRLEAKGHRAIAPDLPGIGSNSSVPPRDVTLALQGECIREVILGLGEAVVLVGHSMGGPVISEVAEHLPERILGLVYAAALLLPSGSSMSSWMGRTGQSRFHPPLSEDGLLMLPPVPEEARKTFYNTCSAEDADAAIQRLQPQPIGVRDDVLQLSERRFGSVQRCYIECLRDNALPLAVQQMMTAHLPCNHVFQMDSCHSPFLCRPEEFTGLLIQAEAAFQHPTKSSRGA